MSDSPKSNTIWWIAGGVVVAYLLYNHGTTGTVSTVTTGRGSNIGLPQTKRTIGGFTTRPTVGDAQINLRNTTATGAISTTSTSQQSILNGILAGINKLASKGGGSSLGGGGGGGGGNNTPSSKNGNATGDGASAGVSTASTALSTPSVYNGGSQSATSSTASGAAALSAASSTGSANSLVDPAQSALS